MLDPIFLIKWEKSHLSDVNNTWLKLCNPLVTMDWEGSVEISTTGTFSVNHTVILKRRKGTYTKMLKPLIAALSILLIFTFFNSGSKYDFPEYPGSFLQEEKKMLSIKHYVFLTLDSESSVFNFYSNELGSPDKIVEKDGSTFHNYRNINGKSLSISAQSDSAKTTEGESLTAIVILENRSKY